jgi:hypothetical protein
MLDREKVISCLTDIENIMIARQDICPREELQYWIELQEGVADALALLKEQEKHSHELQQIINDGFEAMKVATKRIKELEAMLKEQEAKPLRCKKCNYHRDDGWCNEHGKEVKESDYCSFGAWEGR